MLAIQNKILEFGKDYCKDKFIKDVRLGLGYSCAELSDGCMGVARTPEERACTCTQLSCITATSIINGTLDGILEALGNVREAVILGPSTPMCKEVFANTKITRLSGSYVMNNEGVKNIVSEGGGTKLLKKHLRFTTVNVL